MPFRLQLFLLLLLPAICVAQKQASDYNQQIRQLSQQVQQAASDSEKVAALGRLAIHYYIYKDATKGDSVLQEQLSLAESSANRNLVLQVLFSYTAQNINSWNSVATFDKALQFVDRGLAHARSIGRHDYQAMAHIRKAAILRNRNRFDAALEQTAQAALALEKSPQDSVRTALLLEIGDIFLGKGNALTAYEHYNQAYDLAYTEKAYGQQTAAFHHIAMLYNGLGRADLAENILHKSLEANRGRKDPHGMLYDYVDLARVAEQKEYIQRALQLSDSLGSERNRMFAKQLMFAYHMVVEKNSAAALSYLHNNPDLYQLQLNRGPAQFQWQIGSVYFYASQPDSAIVYYKNAESELRQALDAPGLIELNQNIGNCYLQLGAPDKALPYFASALSLSRQLCTLLANRQLLLSTSQAQAAIGDYKAAHSSNEEYLLYLDSANRVNSGRELALLEVERANNIHQHDLQELEHKMEREKYLQYNIISLAIVVLFVFLIVAGMFPVSKFVTKMLGYISFICLFEFIILLIDTSLHHAAHGKPLYIWLGKIFIIALLVPIHHFLEHLVVKFVQSQKLKQLRSRVSLKNWNKAGGKRIKTVAASRHEDAAAT
ncbi:tetratricopeptide repeat protein [Paracnuella aquatica]|uniref:tetratricopeptide repeat protein n=1 Tax=Paracnuella aquatica TaxID=2268757 RepID=UPI000DEF0690|nr:tetratricopeptide repeat protein [Paracnuella aquatica]RPD47536.1 tetratricopeptide repeat protein [Paracnuella aquatica]